jgi:NAD(P)H dehydrogenase (quinone)
MGSERQSGLANDNKRHTQTGKAMTIVVTGATGLLGHHIIDALLARGVPPKEIVAAGRSQSKLAQLELLGVRTAPIDFSDPASIDAAIVGAQRVVLVSGRDPGGRIRQHANVIDSARKSGVDQLVYTSAPSADTTDLAVAPEHKGTEAHLISSGLAYTVLRNNWYNENYEAALRQASSTGVYTASTGVGRVASAARKDYGEAAAVVLTSSGHDNAVYELSGDTAWTGLEFADILARILGRPVTFDNLTPEEHATRLRSIGLDEDSIAFVVSVDSSIATGALDKISDDLSRLIGHPTTPIAESLASFAKSVDDGR